MAILNKHAYSKQIAEMLSVSVRPVVKKYSCVIHTTDNDIEGVPIQGLNVDRNYLTNISDVKEIILTPNYNVYVNDIYKYRNNLELTLILDGDETSAIKYKMVIDGDNSPVLEGSNAQSTGDVSQDVPGVLVMSAQLINRSVEVWRGLTVGGIYKGCTTSDMLTAVLSKTAGRVMIDGKPIVESVDVVKGDNERAVRQITIPDGTAVTKLHKFIQGNASGIYLGGICQYIQNYRGKNRVFVFPPYNYVRHEKETPKALFYEVPGTELRGLETVHMYKDDTLHILVTGNKVINDDGESSMMDTGVGFRTANPSYFMRQDNPSTKYLEVTKDDVVGNRETRMNELIISKRDDGINISHLYSPTINLYKLNSIHQPQIGMSITLQWPNSDMDLIYPGMPCVYMYTINNKLIELTGTILYIHSEQDKGGIESLAVTIYVNKPTHR